TGFPGDLDGSVHSFFRRNPPEKEQIVLRFFLKVERIGLSHKINCPHPLSLRQWAPLRMRNGNNRHIGKLVVNRRQVGQVEPAVQCGNVRKRSATREREVKIVDMEMNAVELVETLKDLLQQDDMMGE